MSDDALFPIPAGARVVPAEPGRKLTPGEALRKRQATRMQLGLHPLSMPGHALVWLHKDAPAPDDMTAPGPRCGGCRFRELLHGESNRRFPKCTFGTGTRASHSTASDVRSWWPACSDFEPKPAPSG